MARCGSSRRQISVGCCQAKEFLHCQHAGSTIASRRSKTPGGSFLPFDWFAANAASLEHALCAYDAFIWTQRHTLDGKQPNGCASRWRCRSTLGPVTNPAGG